MAFLDVMSCGLGAVILIFLLIKHNTDYGSVESEVLLSDLQSIQIEQTRLEEQVDEVSFQNSATDKLGAEIRKRKIALQRALADIENKTSMLQKRNQQLKSANESIARKNADDIIQNPGLGQQEYLIGLAVKGNRIAVLIDHSGSMVDEKIVDIFSVSVSEDSVKQRTRKWLTSKKTLQWIINRVPVSSEMLVLSFNEQASWVGERRWFAKSDSSAIENVAAAIDRLVPEGPTNLHAAFKLLDQVLPRPTDIYLITDGLPTIGDKKDYGRGCKASSKITGPCRANLFNAALKDSKAYRGAIFNVILLPLEGDPDASGLYWQATYLRDGTLLSPAEGWP